MGLSSLESQEIGYLVVDTLWYKDEEEIKESVDDAGAGEMEKISRDRRISKNDVPLVLLDLEVEPDQVVQGEIVVQCDSVEPDQEV
ncbi:hypothetical protein RIF29_25300 [Crotalaria pallida]|uniref:Uncharacterized protein n=1 Tax=Crotalaria pallida TaxID=3830 RepID=A0AAN9HZ64_CROPI